MEKNADQAHKKEAPVFEEIASTRDGRDITRGYVEGLPLLRPQDPILTARGGNYGLGYEVYRELLRDDKVASAFGQRRLAVVSAEYEVQAGGKMRRDKIAADWFRETLTEIDFDRASDKMLYGRFYGYAFGELMLGREGRMVTLEGIKVRSPRRFAFAPDLTPRLLTYANMDGEPLPPRKFWSFTAGGDSDDEPYGLGLAHDLYWEVWFKRNIKRFWAIYLDKHSSPTAIGEYPPGAKEEQQNKLLEAVQAVQSDSGIIVPQGMIIRLLEMTRSSTPDFQAFVNGCNASIAQIILGQTMTSSADGGQYKADVHMDVRDQIVKADADLLCKSFNMGPVRWLTEWNFPGSAPPQVWRKTEQPEDLTERAKRDEVIVRMGFEPSEQYVRDTYGGDWTRKQAVTPPPVPGALPPTDPAFAEAHVPDEDEIDRLAAEELDGWEAQLGEIVDPIDAIEAEDATTFRASLAALLRTVTPTKLADGLARGTFKARGLGDAGDDLKVE